MSESVARVWRGEGGGCRGREVSCLRVVVVVLGEKCERPEVVKGKDE